MIIHRIVICIFLLFPGISSLYSQGLSLFVAPSGNDTAIGNIDFPLRSLEGARDKIREIKKTTIFSDTIFVIIKPGKYHLKSTFTLKPEDSGSSEAPIVYMAEELKNTVFSGGISISGFKETEDGLWVAQVPEVPYWDWTFDQLFVNEKRATRAKSPNNGYFHIKEITEEVWVQGTGRSPEKAQQIVVLENDANQELTPLIQSDMDNVVMTVFHHWNITKRHIDKFENGTIYTSGQGMKPWNPWKPGKRFILENYRRALDAPGEWYLDKSGLLLYKPLPNEKIETSEFTAPVLRQLLRFEGIPGKSAFVKHVIFKDIHFQYAAYDLPVPGFEPYQAAITIDAAIELNGAQHIQFIGCELDKTGGYGLWLNQGVSHCKITQSHLHDLGAGGIRIGELTIREEESLQTHSNVIENCIIQSGGFDFAPGVGILIGQSANNKIVHNDIADFRYTGVSVGWRWGYDYSPATNNKILHNHIHHIGWGVLSDMSGVYTLGPSEGTEVSNNHIHHIYAYAYGGWGLYTDEGSSNITMENNLVHHTKTGGFHQHYGRENIIRNNILAYSEKYQVQATRVEDHLSFSFTNNIIIYNKGVLYQGPWDKMNVKIDKNLYWNTTGEVDFLGRKLANWQKNGYDKNSIISNPLFKEPAQGDFTFVSRKKFKKIDFNPFDYTKYGVYGAEEWKNKAKLSELKIQKFSELYQ